MKRIQVFRKREKSESEKDYVKKVTSEFCISSSLHDSHIVETVDLVQDHKGQWCEVMVSSKSEEQPICLLSRLPKGILPRW
jgi:protein-serine/threonine kinase